MPWHVEGVRTGLKALHESSAQVRFFRPKFWNIFHGFGKSQIGFFQFNETDSDLSQPVIG
jgi:hypothetical protein